MNTPPAVPTPPPPSNRTTTGPKAAIDRQFWYTISADVIKNSIAQINTAAEKLFNFITVWVYALFTGSAVLALQLNISNKFFIYLIPLPFILIALGGIFSIAAQMPISSSFYPQVAATIQKAHQETYKKKVHRLNLARLFVIAGSIITSIIVFFSIILSQKNLLVKPIKIKTISFEAVYINTKKGFYKIGITGYFPPKIPLKYNLYGITSDIKKDTLLSENITTNSESGDFNRDIETKLKSDKYTILIQWEQDGYMKSLSKAAVLK